MNIPLARPYFSDRCREAILEDLDGVLRSGRLITGPFEKRLESLFREKVGRSHAVAVNSCTTALTVCLTYFDVRDREVLVPSGTFVTSVTSVLFAGGRPVLVDMNPETLSFDLEDLRRKVTPRTKGMVWVHLTGLISNEYEAILSLAREKGLFVLEDCAHALGAVAQGVPAGALGDAGCFSFYHTKIITSGTGGMIATRDGDLADFARSMRSFGKAKETGDLDRLGSDCFLDEFRACVAFHQLEELDEMVARRREIAAMYRNLLNGIRGIHMPVVAEAFAPSYYQFPVFLEDRTKRKQLREALLNRHGIESKKIYRPCHKLKVLHGLNHGTLEKTEATLERSLCLPIFPGLSDGEVLQVARAVQQEMDRMP
jgi:perosamine synthetase